MSELIPETEYPISFRHYLSLVATDNLLGELENQLESYVDFVRSIPTEKELYHYAENKWTVKEVIGHNTDTERVKLDCAFRIARGEQASLPGFDEDAYVLATNFNDRSMEDLIEEFIYVRKSAIILYKSLREEDLKRMGTASNKPVSARALFGFLVGHIRHHEVFLKEHYLD
ncbi:MAG: DinB family protein [Crocinitomicaceae bacterium]|nr:DinB family protein [Crocinitomicaceae bacterium]